jgi:hypothetical protein
LIGAVIVNTIGNSETWSEISDASFDDATGVTTEWWSETMQSLVERHKIIRTKKGEARGRPLYSLNPNIAVEAKALKIQGRCRACQAVGKFETEFVPVPHVVFRKLGACLDHASFVCLLVIIRHSLKWTGERGVWGESTQLDLNDFERATGLERRTITEALSRICDPDGWGLVDRTERKGRPALYRAIPERFGKIDRRDARVVVMPERRERTGNTTDQRLREKAKEPEKTIAVESGDRYFAFCSSCGSYGAIDLCEETPAPSKQSESPPIRPPGRETRLPTEQIFSNFKTFKGF